jgi:hypothetical protein
MAVTTKNAAFCGKKTKLIPHRRHITSPPESPADECYVRFEVFTAVTTKNTVFRDVTLLWGYILPKRLFLQEPHGLIS